MGVAGVRHGEAATDHAEPANVTLAHPSQTAATDVPGELSIVDIVIADVSGGHLEGVDAKAGGVR